MKEKNIEQKNDAGQLGVQTGLESDRPLDAEKRYPGDSVDEHKEVESSNEFFAKKELDQNLNNS